MLSSFEAGHLSAGASGHGGGTGKYGHGSNANFGQSAMNIIMKNNDEDEKDSELPKNSPLRNVKMPMNVSRNYR